MAGSMAHNIEVAVAAGEKEGAGGAERRGTFKIL
jgi:hypothetical protein